MFCAVFEGFPSAGKAARDHKRIACYEVEAAAVVRLQAHASPCEEAVLLLGIVHPPASDATGPNADMEAGVVGGVAIVDGCGGRAAQYAGWINRCGLWVTGRCKADDGRTAHGGDFSGPEGRLGRSLSADVGPPGRRAVGMNAAIICSCIRVQ